jgi:hypothetical protein
MSSLHSFSRVFVPFRRGVNIGGVGAVMVCSSRAGVCSVPRPCALHRAPWTVPVGTAAGCTPPYAGRSAPRWACITRGSLTKGPATP